MAAREALGSWDYVVVAFTMIVSVAIGFYFRFTGSKQKSTTEFLMAGKNMGVFPVVFSLVVTKLSAIAIIGEPADVYLYGTQRCVAFIFIFIGSLVTAFVFLPVYFAVGASTIYEYLERRFGKRARRSISIFGYLQTLLNMSVVMYTPAIALSAVTEVSAETSLLLIGGVSILFSSMGGLKAVMWADVFQALMMYLCLFTILIQGVIEVGSPYKLYQIAYEGGRLDFFHFAGDPNTPYTFWNTLSYGIQIGIAHGVNQFEVQRLLAVRTLKGSQSAALWSSIPSFLMSFLTATAGLTLFVVFNGCNPLSKESGTGLTKADQIVPYYIVSRLLQYPGLAGLCISGILSASISSLSSALNSLSTVFVEDFIIAWYGNDKVSALKLNICAKVLVVLHGVVIIGLAFVTSLFTSVLQGVIVLDGMILGPTLGIYLLGVFTERTNETGALIGLICGALFSAWFGLGSSLFGPTYKGKPLSTESCNSSVWNATEASCCSSEILWSEGRNGTISDTMVQFFPLHSVSYIWTYCIGAAITIVLAYIASCILSFGKKNSPIEPYLLCPLVKKRWKVKKGEFELKARPCSAEDR